MKRIGVLTSGGDNPGLNPCIRAVVRMGVHMGLEVMGIRRGYLGLLQGEMAPLGARSVSGIIGQGGTFLGSSRCEEFYELEGQKKAIRKLADFGIDGLVVIGGNGSLTGALALWKLGYPTVGVPGTIDNDVNGTDIAIGVDTALDTILSAVDKIKDTATSHNRAFLIETMGRNSGYLALVTGIAGGAEMALIPERETEYDEIVRMIHESYEKGKTHCIIIVAEGWKPGMDALADHLRQDHGDLGFSVRVTRLGYVQRGGAAGAFDRLLATRLGGGAVRALVGGSAGNMVGLINNAVGLTPLDEAVAYQKGLDSKLYELAEIMAM